MYDLAAAVYDLAAAVYDLAAAVYDLADAWLVQLTPCTTSLTLS